MKRRSTRAARGDVSLLGCVLSVWALFPNRRARLGLNVSSVWPSAASLCDVWPGTASLFDTWISLTSTFDVQSSLTLFCPQEKLLIPRAKTFTRHRSGASVKHQTLLNIHTEWPFGYHFIRQSNISVGVSDYLLEGTFDFPPAIINFWYIQPMMSDSFEKASVQRV